MITTSRPPDDLRRMIDAFREGGGEGKPVYLKVQLSYDPDIARARTLAHAQWRNNIFASHLLSDIRSPQGLDAAGSYVREEDMEASVRISDSAGQHLEWLMNDIQAGVDGVFLHNVNLLQGPFIEVLGQEILPAIRKEYPFRG